MPARRRPLARGRARAAQAGYAVASGPGLARTARPCVGPPDAGHSRSFLQPPLPMSLPALFLVLACLPVPAPCLPAPQEEGQDAVDERPEVKALLDELDGHVKAKGEKDTEAIEVLDKLMQEFPGSG